jgi:Kinesin motor domain
MGSEAHTQPEITENTGLIPRFMNELFHSLEKKKRTYDTVSGFNYQLQASFLEVYGEDVHDLLDKSRQSLPLRENETGGIVCHGLTAKPISFVGQALEVLHEGTLNRTTAATLMNLTSSRSHAVFTVVLTQHETRPNGDNKAQVEIASTSRFTFVDLAGSERMKKTGAEGERAREGIKINEGLLALGNVINALADDSRLQEGKRIHVPYRQSKLTRLLQDALGGNSQTLFLACVSPSDTNASETLSTLRYANRARNIKNAPTRNIDAAAVELQRLQVYNEVLQAELIKSKFRSSISPTNSFSSMPTIDEESDNTIGQCDDDLLNRQDVAAYIAKLSSFSEKRLGPNPFGTMSSTSFNNSNFQFAHLCQGRDAALTLTSPRKHLLARSCTTTPLAKQQETSPHNKSILDDFDPSFLGETNPDEEMAILDQLLDIQHQDQLFDSEKKRDSASLKQMDGELAEQEVLLLQIRKSLEVYHNMKIKYENLMTEVQQLETEKAQLAEKLEQASADPTQGCSSAIKRDMEKVEQSLIRARNETRKHRDMYRKAEQEAQKCRTLERKIAELKTSRTHLIKKQKETMARHKEFTENKTREILALKRKEKKAEKQVSKLQRDLETHKRNLNKRHEFCNKLTEKLKQTESHLMKLLSMRQRDLRVGRTSVNRSIRVKENVTMPQNRDLRQDHVDQVSDEGFAPDSAEIDSLKYLLSRIVQEKANHIEYKRQYEECYARYSEDMRSLLASVRCLEEAKENTGPDSEAIREHEQSVEDLELKVELSGNALERIQRQLSDYEGNENGSEQNYQESVAKSTIEVKRASVLRTLLMDTVENLSENEVSCVSIKFLLGLIDCNLIYLSFVCSRNADTLRKQYVAKSMSFIASNLKLKH